MRSTRLLLLASAVAIGAGGLGITLMVRGGGAVAAADFRPETSAPPSSASSDTLDTFVGVTADGTVISGLFPIHGNGASTARLRTATRAFLDVLSADQRDRTAYPSDDDEWRLWGNTSSYERQGVSFEEMDPAQRELAFAMMREALSARGFEQTRDIMRLNGYLAEISENFDRYGEFLYWLTVMGEPSETEPWGWQLDGHHLVINYFVLGNQVVMTPTFMGSEPVVAESGPHEGTEVLREEQELGLALMRALSAEQQAQARIAGSKTGNNALAQAFRDNLVLEYEGIRASDLTREQIDRLLDLIGIYVGNMPEGHARVRMEEVENYLFETRFAWIGDTGPDDTFYYRIQSPVILIEFDHQLPVALEGPRQPDRRHIHSVVRTPNGNDYGKDLLRQHYERHQGDSGLGHSHGVAADHSHSTDHPHGTDHSLSTDHPHGTDPSHSTDHPHTDGLPDDS